MVNRKMTLHNNFLSAFSVFLVCVFCILEDEVVAQDVFVSNLDSKCLTCLCYAASNCDMKVGCAEGHCGPYQLGMQYWIDAGRPALFRDDPNTEIAFTNCALTFPCAQGAVKHYLAKFGKDCNEDGVTNCDDYAMINYNGAFECGRPLNSNRQGLLYLERYLNCVRHYQK